MAENQAFACLFITMCSVVLGSYLPRPSRFNGRNAPFNDLTELPSSVGRNFEPRFRNTNSEDVLQQPNRMQPEYLASPYSYDMPDHRYQGEHEPYNSRQAMFPPSFRSERPFNPIQSNEYRFLPERVSGNFPDIGRLRSDGGAVNNYPGMATIDGISAIQGGRSRSSRVLDRPPVYDFNDIQSTESRGPFVNQSPFTGYALPHRVRQAPGTDSELHGYAGIAFDPSSRSRGKQMSGIYR